MGALIPRAPVTTKGNRMKIIRVEVYYEIECCQDCDGPGYYTYGYYSEDYDIKQVILSTKKDLDDIRVYEASVNVNPNEKEITDKYINYDVDSSEYEIR